MDRETVITHLQIIHTWASFARERNLQFFTAKHLEDIAQWAYDAITLLGEQKERIETLESLRRIEQETIKALQMGTERERKVTMAREHIVEVSDAINTDAFERFELEEHGKAELCDRCGRRRLKSNRVEGR